MTILYYIATIQDEEFIVYRKPVNKTVKATDSPVLFYYIGATGATSQVGTEVRSVDLPSEQVTFETSLFRLSVKNWGTSTFFDIFLSDDGSRIDSSIVRVGFTVAGKLNYYYYFYIITCYFRTIICYSDSTRFIV